MLAPIDTPIEEHWIRDTPIFVKREDLCWPYPALSKARGVYEAIKARPKAKLIAVVDTGRSLNGLLSATIALTMGRKALVGYPRYKANPDAIPGSANRAKSIGAAIVPIQANRQFVMLAEMKRLLEERFKRPNRYFVLPTGLRLSETVDATAAVALAAPSFATYIVPSGTGTHLAGLMKARPEAEFIAIQGYARGESLFRSYVRRASGVEDQTRLRVVDLGHGYYDIEGGLLPPFPSNLHYETRAWRWLATPGFAESLKRPIAFWNIGA